MKRLLFILLLLLIITAGYMLFVNRNQQTTNPSSPSIATSTPSSQIPNTWKTYTSSEWNFTIKHPEDVRIELTQGGAHFLKLGSTQTTETELFDGLSLLIFSSNLPPNTTFDTFLQREYTKEKNEPITDSITELQPVTIAQKQGFSYTVSAIGKRTVMFFLKGPNEYVKITDSTVEPGNVQRDFHQTVTKMLSTLEF